MQEPPKGATRARSGLRGQLAGLKWAVLGAALPWTWFLVRDLGPVAQIVALALPLLVAASILGVVISAVDERRVTSLIVVASLGLFGWVTVMGPRGAQPSRDPQDPVRVAEVTMPAEGAKVQAVLDALKGSGVAVVAVPAKKERASLVVASTFDEHVVEGPFVILSDYPVKVLPLPKGTPKALIVRVEVDRPDGAFVIYGARVEDALGSTMEPPVGSRPVAAGGAR